MSIQRAAWLIGAVWLAAVLAQSALPLSAAWAVLDGLRHGAAATVAMVWLRPRWGWAPVVAATAAGVLIDLDHVVAAGSVDPSAMLGLGVRPLTHSLVAMLAFAGLAGVTAGRISGFAVGAGILLHLEEDALTWPGVPLLWPLSAEGHVLLPAPVLVITLIALVLTSRWLGASGQQVNPPVADERSAIEH